MSKGQAVRVSPIQKVNWMRNPISGHEWPEHGPVTGYEVRGPLGVWSKHRTEPAAQKEAAELAAYYEKHPIEGLAK